MKKIFISSSSENLDIAYAVQENFEEYGFHPTVWTQNMIKLSDTIIESLISSLSDFDYAIFIFNPSDITNIRDKTVNTVRDNVIFELGLFIGSLGRESCFFITPKNIKNLHLPTDLLGVIPATYDNHRENKVASLGPACNRIQNIIKLQLEKTIPTNDNICMTLCTADYIVAKKRNLKNNINKYSSDYSNLFFLLLSVLDCQKSRILISDIQAEKFPNIKIDAMYDTMGSWDLIIKYRTEDDYQEFEFEIIKKLVEANMINKDLSGPFGKRKLLNITSQSQSVLGLLKKNHKENIFYTLLKDSQDYEKYRASRAFILIEIKGKKNSKQRKLFLEQLNNLISQVYSSCIIESVCESESELVIETFSSCAQSQQINHLNKTIEPILTAHELQRYTLFCYTYDELGLIEDIKDFNEE